MDKDNILLSFPRSGNTWVRYALEYVSKRPTSIELVSDCQEGITKKDPIGLKENFDVDILKKCIAVKRHRADHHWDFFNKDNSNFILLVRSHKEAIIRHLITQNYKSSKVFNKNIDDYLHCLNFYDQFDGNKILIYYEDLITDEKNEFKKIFNFLELNEYDDFFDNIDFHRKKSVNGYEPGSVTKGLSSKLDYHSRRCAGISNIVDIEIKKSPMYDKYLKRFK